MLKVFCSSLSHSASFLQVSTAPTSSLLLLSHSRSVLATLPSPPSFLLPQSFWQNWQELSSPVLSGYNGFPDTRFFWRMMQLMSWPDGKHYLCPLQCLVASLLLSLISTLLFFQTRNVLSLQSSTHRFP